MGKISQLLFGYLILLCVVFDVSAFIILNTNNFQWKLSNENKTIFSKGSAPGGVYGDLMNSGHLKDGDFYYRYNDINYRYVSYQNWTYSSRFKVPSEFFDEERIIFEFEGLDTVSTLKLNGREIGQSENMFVKYAFDVKKYLNKDYKQRLEIKLKSPTEYSKIAFEKQAQNYTVPPVCVDPAYKGECHANFIRKMAASFSWDWGPAFPNMGIWKPWRIIGFSSLKIDNVLVGTEPIREFNSRGETAWKLNLRVFYTVATKNKNVTGKFLIYFDGKFLKSEKFNHNSDDFYFETNLNFSQGSVKTWWPNGYGVRPLYNLTVYWQPSEEEFGNIFGNFEEKFGNTENFKIFGRAENFGGNIGKISDFKTYKNLSRTSDNSDRLKKLKKFRKFILQEVKILSKLSKKSVKIGFRTVELDQNYIDSKRKEFGRHFRFKINNVTMFMKGSNWIPSHVLAEKMTLERAKNLLEAAAKTHQNCLRVWGGGIYEWDYFYELADELGILIWQDFMFACNMYPTGEKFLASVTRETRDQVLRLQHHPSIFIWAGNNENEAALRGNWYGTSNKFETYKDDYVKLYVETVRKNVLKLDDSRPFVVSSPGNGIESDLEGFVAWNPYDNKFGDVHYYNYMSNGWSWTLYPRARFVSEYGFQSWPSFAALKNVTSSEDWSIGSKMMSHRQHHPFGNTELRLQLVRHFNTRKIFSDKNLLENFKYYLYLSQINQAMSVKTETEFYRRSMSDLNEKGEGFTSGALYWQLNDIWQGASWSSIEFGGRWKMLHYFAKHFFSPVLISPWIQDDEVKISIVNDRLTELQNLTVEVRLFSYSKFDAVSTHYFKEISVPSLSSKVVAKFSLMNIQNKTICSENELKFSSKSNWTGQSGQIYSEILSSTGLNIDFSDSKSDYSYSKIGYSDSKIDSSYSKIDSSYSKRVFNDSKIDINEKNVSEKDEKHGFDKNKNSKIGPNNKKGKKICSKKFNDYFLTFQVRSHTTDIMGENFLFLSEPKDSKIQKATVKVSKISKITDKIFKITLHTDVIALFVWLETNIDGVFSDNGFLLNEPDIDIFFEAFQDNINSNNSTNNNDNSNNNTVTVDLLGKRLNVFSLSDTF